MKVYLLTISKKGKSEMRSLAICKQLNKPISFHVRTKKNILVIHNSGETEVFSLTS